MNELVVLPLYLKNKESLGCEYSREFYANPKASRLISTFKLNFILIPPCNENVFVFNSKSSDFDLSTFAKVKLQSLKIYKYKDSLYQQILLYDKTFYPSQLKFNIYKIANFYSIAWGDTT